MCLIISVIRTDYVSDPRKWVLTKGLFQEYNIKWPHLEDPLYNWINNKSLSIYSSLWKNQRKYFNTDDSLRLNKSHMQFYRLEEIFQSLYINNLLLTTSSQFILQIIIHRMKHLRSETSKGRNLYVSEHCPNRI